MNGKKAKALRKATKELFNADASEKLFMPWNPPEFMRIPGESPDMDRYIKVKPGKSCELDPMCGRAMYHKLKASYQNPSNTVEL